MNNMIKSITFLVLVSSTLFSVELTNLKDTRAALGLDRFPVNQNLLKLKIAVIDNGFNGYEPEKKQLPDSTKLILKYDPEFIKKFGLGDPAYNENPAQTEHGRVMAQIAWGISGANEKGPNFYLLNANGITNFKRAVRYAIEEKVDIILYSQNRECCGNFDGGGFLNAIVNEATAAGILWVNAAGNYGGNVFNGTFNKIKADKTVVFNNQISELKLKSNLDENFGQLILTWNSSGLEETTGTEKDLDIFLYDENGKEVAKSVLNQVLKKADLAEGESFLPRERIRFEFKKNSKSNYKVVIKAKSKNFTIADKVRLILIADKQPLFDAEKNKLVPVIEFLDATEGGEIMVPADNPNVITVGELNSASANGPTVDGRVKPEIILENSTANFTNGQTTSGSSNAAAFFTGILAVLKSYQPNLTRAKVTQFPRRHISPEIEKIAMAELLSIHEKLVSKVELMTQEAAVMAGRYRDGRYSVGIRLSPNTVLEKVCGKVDAASTEFYLGLSSTHQVLCFKRNIVGTQKEAYPWEYNGGDKKSYLEVRQVYHGIGKGSSNGRLWVTPTPEELNE